MAQPNQSSIRYCCKFSLNFCLITKNSYQLYDSLSLFRIEKVILKLPVTSHRREVGREKKLRRSGREKILASRCAEQFFFANRLFHFWDYSNQNSYHLLAWRRSRVGNELKIHLNYWFSLNFGKFSFSSAHTTTLFVSSSFSPNRTRPQLGHIVCCCRCSFPPSQSICLVASSLRTKTFNPFPAYVRPMRKSRADDEAKTENLVKTACCCRISRMISEEHLSTMGPRVKANFRRKK